MEVPKLGDLAYGEALHCIMSQMMGEGTFLGVLVLDPFP